MDERKNTIRDLENKNAADNEARNKVFEGLGESLFKRIGDTELFPALNDPGPNTPGVILADYRRLQKEIDESVELIKSLEADIVRLKELEDEISSAEEELSRIEKELTEVYVRLGKIILASDRMDEFCESFKQQEQALIVKIGEHEKKLAELEGKEGNILTWIGKNAQMAVTKAFLSKNRSDLERIYLGIGENAFSGAPSVIAEDASSWKSTEDAQKTAALKEHLSSVSVKLAMLKGERRQMGGLFEADISPARRIQGLEKRISFVREEFPAVYGRMGLYAAEGEGKEVLSPFIKEEDGEVFEAASQIKTKMAERALEIDKIKTAIKIDEEKAEIENAGKSIARERQKISAAEAAIADLEKQIGEAEARIKVMEEFLSKN